MNEEYYTREESKRAARRAEEKKDKESKQRAHENKKKNEIRSWIENLEHELIKDFGELADSNGWLTQLQNLRNELNPSKKSILNTIRKNTKNNEIIKNYCLDIGDSLTDLPHLMLKNRIKEYFKNEAKIGTVFGQKEQLWTHLTPYDNFKFFGAIYDMPENIIL